METDMNNHKTPESEINDTADLTDTEQAAEASIGEALSAFNNALDDDAAPEGDTAEFEESEVEVEPDEVEGSEESDTPEDVEGDDSKAEQPEQQPDDGTPTLPAAHIRSLKAYGWTDAEIQEASGAEKFVETAARIHANRVSEMQAWAAQGRAHKEAVAQEKADPPVQKPGIPAKLDADALKEKYGDSDLVDEIVGAFNPLLEKIHTLMPSLEQGQAAAQQAQLAAVKAEVDSFFTSPDLLPYAEAYGTRSDDMTETQQANRIKLLQTADDLRTAASLRGQDVSAREAMAMAHEIVGANFRASAVRKEIRDSVVKRTNARTIKPGTNTSQRRSQGDPSEAELERKIQSRLRALGS